MLNQPIRTPDALPSPDPPLFFGYPSTAVADLQSLHTNHIDTITHGVDEQVPITAETSSAHLETCCSTFFTPYTDL